MDPLTLGVAGVLALHTVWSEISIGVAAVVALVYVTRTLRRTVSDVLTFLGNHLSAMTESLSAVTTNLMTLNERVDRLHDDNVEAASELRKADSEVTRKVAEQNKAFKTGKPRTKEVVSNGP